MKFRISILSLMLVSLVLLSCTRKQDDKTAGSFSFSVPAASGLSVAQKSNSSLAINDLQTVIINIQTPMGPIVREVDFHDTGAPAGNNYSLTVDNIPKAAGMLAQVLAVYEGPGGSMVFKYGDKAIDTSAGGTVRTSITVASIGASTKMVKFAGRYFNNATGPSGPTGTLVAYYKPAGGKPPMAIYKSDIINGWFSMFVLEGASSAFTFKLNETGATVFSDAHFDATTDTLKINGNNISHATTNIVRITKPASYRNNYGSVELNGEEEVYAGFFADPTSGVSLSGHEACFPNFDQSISGSFVDAALQIPLIWKASSGGASDLRRVSGSGLTKNFEELYGGSGSPCSPTMGVVFSPNRMTGGGSDGSYAGINGPFKVVSPFEDYGGYLKVSHSASIMTLDWDYLSGTAAAGVVDGVTIYTKYNTNTSSSNNHRSDKACDKDAIQQGYAAVQDVASALETVSLSSLSYQGTSLNSGNYYNWKFIACPYRTVGGARKYLTTYIDGSASSNSGNDWHLGWSAAPLTTISTPQTTVASARVTAASVQTDYTELTAVGINSSYIGGELILHISGASGTGCGGSYSLNQYAFTRILNADNAIIRIPKGTFVDGIANAMNGTPTGGGNFCYVNAVTVAHYTDLTLSGSGTVSPPPFDYSSYGGGILAMRVSGTLIVGATSSINGSVMGYPGQTSGSSSGQGGVGTTGTLTGGSYMSNSAGGGGGYGGGGTANSGTAAGGSGTTGSSGMMRLVMGGAGGSMGSAGPNGGGIVLVVANKIIFSVGSVVSANGGNATAATAAGGGAGGSVYIIAKNATGDTSIQVQGLNGSTGTYGGGGGGGGYAQTLLCNTGGMASLNAYVSQGSAGSGSGSPQQGSVGLYENITNPNLMMWCSY